MAKTQAYSIKNVAAVLDGQKIIGFWDGDDVVVVEDLEDVGQMMIGADGSGIFSQSASNGARITIRLQHGSATHRLLLEKLAVQRTPGFKITPFSFSCIDVDSQEGGVAAECFIEKAPSDSKGKNATQREWQLVTANWARNIPPATN